MNKMKKTMLSVAGIIINEEQSKLLSKVIGKRKTILFIYVIIRSFIMALKVSGIVLLFHSPKHIVISL